LELEPARPPVTLYIRECLRTCRLRRRAERRRTARRTRRAGALPRKRPARVAPGTPGAACAEPDS